MELVFMVDNRRRTPDPTSKKTKKLSGKHRTQNDTTTEQRTADDLVVLTLLEAALPCTFYTFLIAISVLCKNK